MSANAAARREIIAIIALASLIFMITMGIRQTVGLFVHPLVSETGLSILEVSMAMAVGQLAWGLFQPLFGAWADKGSPLAALAAGALCLAGGQFLTARADSLSLLVLAQGILSPAGAGAGAFSVLIGIVSARLTPDLRSTAGGIINAGGSLGQFIFAPVVQFVMRLGGYTAGLIFTALSALLMLIPAVALCRKKKEQPAAVPRLQDSALSRSSLREQLGVAFRNPSYLLLHSGFFTCGFHVAFLTTHLPGEIGLHGQPASVSAVCLALIGLSNIAGSLGVGIAGKHFRMKYILACMYISRAAMISIYLAAPKTEMNFYIFAVATGLTWLATVPPTAGIVGKLFGLRYLATLFALTMLTHQVGAFFGAWLGGLAMQQSQSLVWVWHVDVALALLAAFVNLPIKEATPGQGV